MLIIFDLDDTLIDTSGCITPHRLRSLVPDEGSYQELSFINEACGSSQKALIQFAERRGLGGAWLKEASERLFEPLPEEMEIPLTLGAQEILDWLSQSNHAVALVTGGNPSFQLEKLEKSGVNSFPFHSVAIAEDSNKKPYYQSLARAFGCSAREILVCGDRPAMDLLPAYELGFRVFLRRWGRGLKVEREPWMDGEVWNLLELIKELA